MVNLNRQIRATQARQGGFSAHQLGAPVAYEPFIGWGMGWLFTNDPPVDGAHDVTTVTGISGDGSASATFTVDSGGDTASGSRPERQQILPVFKDTFIVMFLWRILVYRDEGTELNPNIFNLGDENELINPTTFFFESVNGKSTFKDGWGKKGLLLSRGTAQEITIPDSLAPFADSALFMPQASFLTNDPELDILLDFRSQGTGDIYGDERPPGGRWRASPSPESGFARFLDEELNPLGTSPMWYETYTDPNGLPYRLERETSMLLNQWQLWADGVSTVDEPVSFTPVWSQPTPGGSTTFPSVFQPLISIPFTDRRQYFEDEFGLVIP
jgi:hypothetical protein